MAVYLVPVEGFSAVIGQFPSSAFVKEKMFLFNVVVPPGRMKYITSPSANFL